MGKIRTVKLGDEEKEKKQAKKAEARREAKKMKKHKEEEIPSDVVAEGKTPEESDKEEKKDKKQGKPAKQKVRSKRYQEAAALVDKKKVYSLAEAIPLLKK